MRVAIQVAMVVIVVLAIGVTRSLAATYDVEPISQTEAAAWIQWLHPLPHQVEISGKVVVAVSSIQVLSGAEPTQLDQRAAEQLTGLLKEATGTAATGGFVIDLRRRDTDAETIGQRPNADQAYFIKPTRDAQGHVTGLYCGANTDVGTYYAALTLKQLLAPMIQGSDEAATVAIPVCEIVDWPDMEERGQWGNITEDQLQWLGEGKFNLIETHSKFSIDAERVLHVRFNQELMTQGRSYAIKVLPYIAHPKGFSRKVFPIYPHLQKNPDKPRAMCFSEPETKQLYVDWMTALASIEGVDEVSVWMTEHTVICNCEQCSQHNWWVLQTQVFLDAWQEVKKTYPDLGLRILLTQGSYPDNDKLLAMLPDGVKAIYYHGGLTYNVRHIPMIYPGLAEYAQQGGWLSVVPILSITYVAVGPFTNPSFVNYRMTEFVDKGLSGLMAYVTPNNWYYQGNVEAAQEWSWNAHGRSPREFAVSYALRHGINQPEKFGDWSELLSPVSWHIYGCNFPAFTRSTPVEHFLVQPRKIGEHVFRDYTSEEQFTEDLARCDAALVLANEIGDEGFILETRIIQAYAQVMKSFWELSKLVHGTEGVKDEDRAAAQHEFDLFSQATETAIELYPRWSAAAAPQLKGKDDHWFHYTIQLLDTYAGSVGQFMEKLGFEDKDKLYRTTIIGKWQNEQFVDNPRQEMRMDVSDQLDGPGAYILTPMSASGWLSPTIHRVALVSYPKGTPDDTREETVDDHRVTIHYIPTPDGIYKLPLDSYNPDRGYAVVVQIEQKLHHNYASAGEFQFRKLRPDSN